MRLTVREGIVEVLVGLFTLGAAAFIYLGMEASTMGVLVLPAGFILILMGLKEIRHCQWLRDEFELPPDHPLV